MNEPRHYLDVFMDIEKLLVKQTEHETFDADYNVLLEELVESVKQYRKASE